MKETKLYVCLNTNRDCYALNQMGATMTIGELIDRLSEFDRDMPVAFRNDRGYTYGSIDYYDIDEYEAEEDEQDED